MSLKTKSLKQSDPPSNPAVCHRLLPATETARLFWTLRRTYRLRGFRLPVVVETGEPADSSRLLSWIEHQRLYDHILWVSATPPEAGSVAKHVTANQFQPLLGTEYDAVVFDLYSGVHADALVALAGTIKAGGVLIMVGPPLTQYKEFRDPDTARLLAHPFTEKDVAGHFLHYFSGAIQKSQNWAVFRTEQQRLTAVQIPAAEDNQSCSTLSLPTRDQLQMIEQVHALTQQPQGVLTVRAGRGRGKSSALGMAVDELLQNSAYRVWVTAPSRLALQSFDRFSGQHPGLQFSPPDEIMRKILSAETIELPDMLIIDEAAAISTRLLKAFTSRFPRLVFSTTTHGYEGTGQGFVLRFFPWLQKQTIPWQDLTMETPVRWNRQDPLESFLDDCFSLNAESPDLSQPTDTGTSASTATLKPRLSLADPSVLAEHPEQLKEIMQLLTAAHYRTTPDDMRTLLDSPGVTIALYRAGRKLVGAALIAREPSFTDKALSSTDNTLEADIWFGKRRPRGHLLQQSLAQQMGIREALSHPMFRIIRITIHPTLQNLGLGSGFLRALQQRLKKEEPEAILGASFAGEPEVLSFWLSNGFTLVRLGLKPDHVSGSYAALVIRSQTRKREAISNHILRKAKKRFQSRMAYDLHCDSYPKDYIAALGTLPVSPLSSTMNWTVRRKLRDTDLELIRLFAEGARPFEPVQDLLCRLPCTDTCPLLMTLKTAAARQTGLSLAELGRAAAENSTMKQADPIPIGRKAVQSALRSEVIALLKSRDQEP